MTLDQVTKGVKRDPMDWNSSTDAADAYIAGIQPVGGAGDHSGDESSETKGETTSAETMIPASPGKGEAMRTFLARGGGLNALGQYRSGPMKGMTVGQAQSLFESKWSGASGAVKDKYARRAGDPKQVLSPWEREQQGIDRKEPASAMYARQKQSRKAFYSRVNGSRPAPPASRETVPAQSYENRNAIPDVIQRPSQSVPAMLSRPTDSEVVSASRPAWRGPSGNVGASTPAKSVTPGGQPLSPLAQGEIAKRKAAVGGTPTGRMAISDKDAATASRGTGTRVNPITGLPFGHMPGDSLPVGADPAMLNR
ncbi:MAG: hypothetical protein KDN05_23040, partial [Verrucomicrobiae bacterium]|nr:hypothetical protein [Verrucomicrobiae bacterium]